MLKNYIIIALRNILKNRLYAFINIVGLAIGLTVYVFGSVLVDYEQNHDRNFANTDRIYTVNSLFSPAANIGLERADTTYAAFGEFLKAGMPDLEAMARIKRQEFLVSIGPDDYYQEIRFADPDFTKIFDLDYIVGDASALNNPSSIILTRSGAEKYFGGIDSTGQTILLDHKHSLTVAAVVEDLPPNTHFNSSLFGEEDFMVLAPLSALKQITEYDPALDWGNISLGNRMYLMVPPNHSVSELEASLATVYEQHFAEDQKEFIIGLTLEPLSQANTSFWDGIGMPVINSISILAALVLVVACVNYANLATAQNMGRAREVGLRRTLGAGRQQLLIQFLTESLIVALIALLIALVLLELIVPFFNQSLDKVVTLDYLVILPWLALTTLAVGLISGGYPAYLITRATPIDSLKDGNSGGPRRSIVRATMIGVQFVIAIFMLATAMVMYFQNQKVKQTFNLFPTEQILVLERLNVDEIAKQTETLRNELIRLPNVENVSFMSQVPFEQSNSSFEASVNPSDESAGFSMNLLRIDYEFLSTLDVALLAGRNVSRNVASDGPVEGAQHANVLVNELAVEQLGFGSPETALGQSFFQTIDEEAFQFTIVGVVENQNFLGFHNKVKPFTFQVRSAQYYGAVRFKPVDVQQTLQDIEAVWDRVIPNYPMQSQFLNETFEDVYTVMRSINVALSGFAALALSLALIGLFGLAAFMAEQRTKEIGIRRIMGASVRQVVRLLIWQFSKPVLWALLVALPVTYFSMNLYLDFFSDRIGLPAGIIAVAGLIGVFAAWGIVAMHAASVARANPIDALRYE